MPRVSISDTLYTEPYEHGWTLYRKRDKDKSKMKEGADPFVWDKSWHANLEQALLRALAYSTDEADSLESALDAIKKCKDDIVKAIDSMGVK